MTIRINDETVMDSFSDTIPDASDRSEEYLRAVAGHIRNIGLPVALSMDVLSGDGLRREHMPCLVAEPIDKRLRHYKSAHYAQASGLLLHVGWYLVGGGKATGGWWGVGGATQRDADAVQHLIQSIHTYAVMQAMQELVDNRSSGTSGGFLGL